MDSLKPVGITADRNLRQLSIEWNTEHKSIYPFSLLRYACPCAECRGGHDKMSPEPDPEVFTLPLENSQATRIKNLEAVGTYAITIIWEDGHNYGIYNWRYLRSLCPCPLCRPIISEE
jgi:DUF971 family protein